VTARTGLEAQSLALLSADINAAHRACEQAARSTLEHAYRTGELLIEAKATLRHGEWLPWLEANCEVSDRQARTYMRLARELPKSEVGSDLSLKGALRAIEAPEPEPEPQAEGEERAQRLGELEEGIQRFVEAGEALLAVRDRRLYRESHRTFEDYCRERWGLERANQAIDFAQAVRGRQP